MGERLTLSPLPNTTHTWCSSLSLSLHLLQWPHGSWNLHNPIKTSLHILKILSPKYTSLTATAWGKETSFGLYSPNFSSCHQTCHNHFPLKLLQVGAHGKTPSEHLQLRQKTETNNLFWEFSRVLEAKLKFQIQVYDVIDPSGHPALAINYSANNSSLYDGAKITSIYLILNIFFNNSK